MVFFLLVMYPIGSYYIIIGFVAITLGAGVQWHEAYDAAQAQGRVLVGGVADGGSVGAAGGWLMGGGHSAIAPAYGLGKIPELSQLFSSPTDLQPTRSR